MDNNPFGLKVGDKVICIDARGRDELVLGEIYTLCAVRPGQGSYHGMMFCFIKECDNDNFMLDRFQPANLLPLEKVIWNLK